tara:strand:- start:20 stop:568 length:549 start_codon:yes stop_codon:yes gene_type:complete
MKKILLLLLPLLLIISCETDDDDASLVGTWNIQSVTSYEGTTCTDNPEVEDVTGTITYSESDSESVVTINVNNILSFTSFCDDIDGAMVDDTTCSFDDFDFTVSNFASLCNEEIYGELDADNNCTYNWSEEFEYTYDAETDRYCETDTFENTDCGTLSISGNSATIQMVNEDAECTVIELSK